MFRLPRFLPYGVAMEMALTAQPILAEQAHEYGLVTRLCDPGEAVDCALELAERISKNAPLAVAVSKQLIRATQGRTEAEMWELQKPLGAKVIESKDATEGPLAFIQKRRPELAGRIAPESSPRASLIARLVARVVARARTPCRPQASRHPTQVTSLSMGTLKSVRFRMGSSYFESDERGRTIDAPLLFRWSND